MASRYHVSTPWITASSSVVAPNMPSDVAGYVAKNQKKGRRHRSWRRARRHRSRRRARRHISRRRGKVTKRPLLPLPAHPPASSSLLLTSAAARARRPSTRAGRPAARAPRRCHLPPRRCGPRRCHRHSWCPRPPRPLSPGSAAAAPGRHRRCAGPPRGCPRPAPPLPSVR